MFSKLSKLYSNLPQNNCLIELNQSDLWAKTNEDAIPILSVLDHGLQSGYVAIQLHSKLPTFLQDFLPEYYQTITALHDIGKLSPGFQMKSQYWKQKFFEQLLLSNIPYTSNHAQLSASYLSKYCNNANPLLALPLGGHHGSYTASTSIEIPSLPINNNDMHPSFINIIKEYIETIESTFIPLNSNKLTISQLHYLTGFIIFSDWIASSIPNIEPDLKSYTLNQSISLLNDIYYKTFSVKPKLTFSQSIFKKDYIQPNDMQVKIGKLADERCLYIIESSMGDGKTEAALWCTYKLLEKQLNHGLYFGLPTQLTSNKMYDRVLNSISNMSETNAVTTLNHSNSRLVNNNLNILDGSQSPSLIILKWLSTSRTSLISDICVGTIDQALMSTMNVRFSALRYFALSGKVIIFDEVHSYDRYTSKLLDNCIKFLLDSNCSVIILSATLSDTRRKELMQLVNSSPTIKLNNSYPLITKCNSSEITQVPTNTLRKNKILLSPLSLNKQVHNIVSSISKGGCALVIKNTVNEAQLLYKQLKNEVNQDTQVLLLHSRFSNSDRLVNESNATTLIGKNGPRPDKLILIGTQVLEQSLDIDADVLFTDICPIDLLLQRIGRLWRHDLHNRPVKNPICYVLSPILNINYDITNIKKLLKPNSYIYPSSSLLLTHLFLKSHNSVSIPDQMRDVINFTSDDITYTKLIEQESIDISNMLSKARSTELFSTQPVQTEDESISTRYNISPSKNLILLRNNPIIKENSAEFHFYSGEKYTTNPKKFDPKFNYLLSTNSIKCPYYITSSTNNPELLDKYIKSSIIGVLKNNLISFPFSSTSYKISYSSCIGLEILKTESQNTYTEEENWY